jgi:hypothetical protein
MTKWGNQELRALKALRAEGLSAPAIGLRLGRSFRSIEYAINYYRIKQYKQRWSEEEVVQLKKLLPTHSSKEIALVLNRSPHAILTKAYRLGLSRRE